ncbi:MAG: hypothetical protein KatS3mg039_1735 [Candidatus Kapaibacterium sp.]|nr:MAG: hypothetical protein KatS3mg039_1735 [Candidatus Kapabacteria bacterium]
MARKRNVPDSTKPPPIKERGKPEGIPLPQRADAALRLESLRGRVVRLLRKICSEQELVEDAWCEGLTRMLNKFPNGEWEFLDDVRLVNIVFGAARNWLRDHEPSVRLTSLLPDVEHWELNQGEHSNADELITDRSLNPEELVASRIDLLCVLRQFSCEELFFLFARWLDFEHEEIAHLAGMQPAAVRQRCTRIQQKVIERLREAGFEANRRRFRSTKKK